MPLSNKTLRLIAYTLVISGSFYLGTIVFPIFLIYPQNNSAVTIRQFAPILESAGKKGLVLNADDSKVVVKNNEITKWIEPYVRAYSGQKDLRVSYQVLSIYLKSIAADYDMEPVNARFTFENNRAEIFVPAIKGHKLDIDGSAAIIAEAILENKASVSLVFNTVDPEITLDKINNLGIKSLLGKGQSDYGKSSASRINNIKVGLSKYNGLILKPGEEFSFNKYLGEVDEKNGYKPELVIKSGKLVKEYGGGLCQVATTVFRAAILSGLEIKERKPHSFAVHYYDPQGFDATIYPGTTDLRFVNNTNNHILIQTKLSGGRLTVDFYGSNEGVTVTMDKPVSYAMQPSGAMKAYFIRKIFRGGNLEKEERFDSVYKAPPPHPVETNPYL